LSAAAITTDVPQQHPAGLWVLFITEMWERFSYYGMRALLVFYLVQRTGPLLENGKENWNPGFGWTEESAYLLYGIYTWAVYITPLAGGWLADRFLGTHRSLLIGGWIIAAGHVTLALTELFGFVPGEPVTMQTAPGALLCFIAGLLLIVIGTGFFKPCVSVMVGQLYTRDDPRKDSGFTIFYMGINLGAFLSPLIAGTLGEKVGWHYGFGAAAVGMILGLIFYQLFRPRYMPEIGLPPDAARRSTSGSEEERRPLTSADWERIVVILVLAFLGNIFFWTAFEQAGSSLSIFALKKTDRTLGGWYASAPEEAAPEMSSSDGGEDGPESAATSGFPASWYQSVNPLAILLFGPVFAWLWVWLDRRKLNPSTPMKFALGLYLLGLAFLAMVAAAFEAQSGLAGPQWLLLTYVVYTWGELCLSPVGLSMITRLAPPGTQSLMMGAWFFSMSLSNLLAGQVAAFSRKLESGEWTFIYPGLPGFFLMLVVFPIAAGVILTVLTPWLKRMMHGVH
jgi:POT family proton-dependent oligopeptide transporter